MIISRIVLTFSTDKPLEPEAETALAQDFSKRVGGELHPVVGWIFFTLGKGYHLQVEEGIP